MNAHFEIDCRLAKNVFDLPLLFTSKNLRHIFSRHSPFTILFLQLLEPINPMVRLIQRFRHRKTVTIELNLAFYSTLCEL